MGKSESNQPLLHFAILHAAQDNFGAAKLWIERYSTLYGTSSTQELLAASISGAKSRTAAELIRFYKTYPGGSMIERYHLMQGGFAADFDFAEFNREIGTKGNLSGMIRHWVMRDKAAAWEAVKQNLASGDGENTRPFSNFVDGMVAANGELEGVRWIIGKLDELPKGQQERYAEILARNIRGEEAIHTAAAALSGQDRMEFVANILKTHQNPDTVFSALETLPRENLFITLAENWNADGLSIGSTTSYERELDRHEFQLQLDARVRLLTGALDRFAFTADERVRLQKLVDDSRDDP
ncbi:MAG: hypothetical protein EOP87_13100 [Verrucomicrobiaceae bacterium]|nr:MAG: hypothetical protein EOP87_13100 [Verrucomicrobiaceae bacterium]